MLMNSLCCPEFHISPDVRCDIFLALGCDLAVLNIAAVRGRGVPVLFPLHDFLKSPKRTRRENGLTLSRFAVWDGNPP